MGNAEAVVNEGMQHACVASFGGENLSEMGRDHVASILDQITNVQNLAMAALNEKGGTGLGGNESLPNLKNLKETGIQLS